jgi:hypothetical protein
VTEHDHEEGLTLFLLPNRRARFRMLLAAANRAKLQAALPHTQWIDQRFATTVSPAELRPSNAPNWLRRIQAPKHCYSLSESPLLDRKLLPSQDAILMCMSDQRGFATFLSFRPGLLALYVDENASRICLLKRPLGSFRS